MTWLLETVLGDYRTNARILFLLSKLSGLINGLIIRNDDAWMSCLIARNNSQLVLINFKLNDYAIKRSLIKILAWYIANLIITLTLLMSKASYVLSSSFAYHSRECVIDTCNAINSKQIDAWAIEILKIKGKYRIILAIIMRVRENQRNVTWRLALIDILFQHLVISSY